MAADPTALSEATVGAADGRADAERTALTGGETGLTLPALETFRRNPDLTIIGLLLLVTACGSRPFSQSIQVGPFYITEIAMGTAGLIALVRLGISESWAAVRRLPLIALAVIWIAGIWASVRGLRDYELAKVSNDIGLFDYSLLLPLFALVVTDRKRWEAMFAVLVGCGFVGIATFAITFTADQISGTGGSIIALQGMAAGLYMALAVAWIAARLVHGVPTPRGLVALVPVALVLMALTTQRSVLVVAILMLATVVALGPRARILKTGAVAGAVLAASVALAIGIEAGLNATSGGIASQSDTTIVTGTQDGGGTTQSGGEEKPQLVRELGGLGEGGSEEGENVTWRLAYWKEILSRVPSHDPLLGVGFGQPAAYVWNGRKYDFRDGDPGSGLDVAGPHNSFVSWIYRMGVPAFMALLLVMFVGARNAWRYSREGAGTRGERVAITTVAGMWAAGIGVSLFNESLTGPFLGLYFWASLALLLLWPAVRRRDAAASSSETSPEPPPLSSSSVAAS